jgi:ATP-binding protein involved in chromosome partitioning
MSLHICSNCGHKEPIFGTGGGEKMAAQYAIDLLGALPLDIRIREQTDSGTPTVALDPNSTISQIYRDIAKQLVDKLSLQAKDNSGNFPKIVIKND